jgi:hypothetical protein
MIVGGTGVLSRKDVYIIRDRKPDVTYITLIHRQTGLRYEAMSAESGMSEDEAINTSMHFLSEDVAEHYRS